jgi:cell fate regulator YaaT (PSP1 superfamily)
MTTIVGVRFKDSGKIYYFDPGAMELHQGDMVIVDTARGPEMAKVAYGRSDVPESELVGELKPVMRRAEQSDFDRMRALQARHDEVMARCAEKIEEHGLPMGLVKTEYSFDGSRLTFYFTSEQRVDFRMLVRDLARTFRSRIELRQIGPRDEAKLLGGIGPCGRLLCCATFLPDYARVSIKMAKDQDLPLNPTKISGVCGRLLCCLSYEHGHYVDMKTQLPNKNDWVQTPDGPGDVIAVNVLKETVTVRLASSGMEEDYTIAQIEAATNGTHAEARRRTQEGITPAAYTARAGEYADEDPDSALLRLLEDDNDTGLDDDQQQSGSAGKSRGSKSRAASSKNTSRARAPQPASDNSTESGKSSRRSRRRKRPRTAQTGEDQPNSEQEQHSSEQQSQQPATSKRSRPRRRKRKPASGGEQGTQDNQS